MVGYSLDDKTLTCDIAKKYESILISITPEFALATKKYLKNEIVTLIYNNKFIVYVYGDLDKLEELYIYDDIFELAKDWRF